MRVRRALVVSTVISVVVGGLLLGGAAPVAATTTTTILELAGEQGAAIATGTVVTLTEGSNNLSGWANASALYFHTNYPNYGVQLVAPTADGWQVGTTYTQAARNPEPGKASLDVWGDGRGCNQTTGSITFDELTIDPTTGMATSFAVHFDFRCDNRAYGTRGSLAFNSALPYEHLTTLVAFGGTSAVPSWGVDVRGKLVDGAGPMAAQTIHVSRVEGDIATPLPDVVTDSQGKFSVPDLMGDASRRYELSFSGAGDRSASSTSWTVGPTLAQPTVLVTGPSSVTLHGQVHLSGVLSDAHGPMPGVALTVSRDEGSGPTPLPDVVTQADGTFALTDVLGTVTTTYTFVYGGDAIHSPAQATWAVTAAKYSTTLVVSAPASGRRGVGYTVSAVLTSHLLRVPGAVVSVRRSDLAGTRTFSLRTSSSGVVIYRDTPSVGGPVTWTLSWAGDATRSAVTGKKIVTIARSSTVLGVRTSASKYRSGDRATISVHLGATYNRRDVYLYARPLGPTAPAAAPGVLVGHARVNASGNAVFAYLVRARTVFTVRFAGDYRFAPAARSVTPTVTAKVAIQVGTAGYASGGVYHFTSRPGYFRAAAAPYRSSGCAAFQVQRLVGTAWREVDSACVAFATDHWAYAQFTPAAAGITYRIRAYVVSNAYSYAGSSQWVTFTFAR